MHVAYQPVRFLRRRGFTLAEILVVVVILGIASAVVVPNLGTRNDLNVQAASRVLMADLIYAQNRAIMTATYQYVKFDTSGQNYSLLSSKPNVTAVYVQNPVSLKNYTTQFGSVSQPQLQRCSISSVNFDNKTCLAFDELGQPYACDASTGVASSLVSGSVVVTCGTFSLTVSIEPYTGALNVH